MKSYHIIPAKSYQYTKPDLRLKPSAQSPEKGCDLHPFFAFGLQLLNIQVSVGAGKAQVSFSIGIGAAWCGGVGSIFFIGAIYF